MNNLNLDKYLDIVNKEKKNKGLESFIPLYPMFRVEKNKLYVGVMITDENDNVWSKDSKVKAEYWVLISIDDDSILEFNDTSKYDFVIGKLIEKNTNNKQEEISKYIVKKTLQYKNYLIEDIKNQDSPLQKKLSSLLDNEIIIDGEKININDYLVSNLEQDIKQKVDELVDILVQSRYGSITFYYDNLFKQIIDEYKSNNIIDKEKLSLCCEIMNDYYDGVIGIDNFFNI